jgi:membrane-bound metal-dependent hydrolase YbcI (DUF457 family)
MPDLFSHLAAARLPAAFLRDRRLAALLVIGTFLPDLAAKGFFWVLRTRETYEVGTHSLVGVVLISYLAALFLEEPLRTRGFLALATGGLVHVAVDMLKISYEHSGLYPLYPFSMWHGNAGWIDPVNVAVLLPIDLAILAVAWALERSRTRVRE